MGFLSSFFGYEGTVRFTAVCDDGRTLTGKTQIETFNLDNSELEEYLVNMCFVEEGVRVHNLKIIGMT